MNPINSILDKISLAEEDLSEIALISALPWAKAKEMLKLPGNVQGLSILDVGGGASDITATLLEMGADAHAIDPKYRKKSEIDETVKIQLRSGAYDLTTRMLLNKTLQRFMASSKTSSERYQAASAVNIPFPDNSFDFVFSIDTITAFLDMDRTLLLESIKECLRVAKPGGSLQFLPFQDIQPAWPSAVNDRRLANDEHLLHWLRNNTEVEGIKVIKTSVKHHNSLTLRKKLLVSL